jgi:NitT/TauT family transport system substrate-binding protein
MKLSRLQMVAGSAAVLLPTVVRAQTAVATVRTGAVPSEQALPFVYAMRAGLFERAGLRIENSKLPSGSAIAAAIAGNALDIGLSSMLSLVVGRARGVPFTIVAPSGLWLPSSEGGLLVASSSPLRTPKDFLGKTVSTAAVNDINSVAMQAWLDHDGLDFKAVKFVEIPQLAAPVALEQGRIDGAMLTNPAFTIAVSGGKARFVANVYSAISPRFLLGAMFSTTGWVERNRSAAERFSRVIAEASTYVNTHVNETIDDLVEFTGVERSLIARMKRSQFGPTVVLAEVQPMIDAAAKYKAIEKGYPASELVSDVALK